MGNIISFIFQFVNPFNKYKKHVEKKMKALLIESGSTPKEAYIHMYTKIYFFCIFLTVECFSFSHRMSR